jgi:Mg-chelatase subunit ChlD
MINDRTIVVKETYSRGSIPFIIAIDSSASMNFSSRIQIAKELSEMLLKKLYLIRSRVALVEFSGKSARVIMNFSKNFTTLKSEINNIKGGGKTPLYDALKSIYLLSSYEKMKTISLLITDGRGNVFPDDPVRCLKDISCKIMPLSELYIIDRNNNRFLPSYRDLIETWGGAKVIDDLNSVL